MSALSGFVLVLLGFGFLIFIHELGHFLAAKWAGIRADGFAIGMGPCIASYRKGVGFTLGSADAKVVSRHGKRTIEMSDAERERHGLGETEYSLRALPIGGYVRMLGQEDGNPGATSDDRRSFTRAPHFRRGVVILAGIAANLALAIVLFLVAFLVGVRFPAPTVGFVAPAGPAARAEAVPAPGSSIEDGLRPGDVVTAIDGEPVATFIDMRVAAAMAKPGAKLAIDVDRAGTPLRFLVEPKRDERMGLLSIGVDPARSTTITDVRSSRTEIERILAAIPTTDGGTLAKAGMRPGSRIESVNTRAASTFAALDAATMANGAAPLRISWSNPDGTRGSTEVAPDPQYEALREPATGDETMVELGVAGFVPLARVRGVVDGSPNAESLRAGDVFLRVNLADGPTMSDVRNAFRAAPSSRVPAVVLREGVEQAVDVRTDGEGRAGVYLEPAFDLPLLARTVDVVSSGEGTRGTPAKPLALLPRSRIASVDGTPVATVRDLRNALVAKATATAGDGPVEVRLGVRDPSESSAPREATVTLSTADLDELRELGHAFPVPETVFDPEFTVLSANGNPLTAVAMGFRQTVVMVEQVFLTIDRVGRGSVGVDQLQGPVGILHTGTQVADEGFMYILFFLALISVNLAVVNALPIPIADGGLLMFLIYEKLAGKPPSIAFQNAAATVGIALVAGLFLLTFYNDIARIFG
ncbi:MAG: site-2 protease family protein [Planctomycetota bacterium]